MEITPLDIFVYLVLAVIISVLTWLWRMASTESNRQREKVYLLEKTLMGEGSQTCCACGKPYFPLNDPDYTPELNVCRDCLWKMDYERYFGDDR